MLQVIRSLAAKVALSTLVLGAVAFGQYIPAAGTGVGSGTVTSVTVAGTANQITVTGTCSGTTVISCTLSLPNGLQLPGTINKLTLTQPATGATITVLDGKVVTVNKTLTFDGTDGVTITFPSSSATLVPDTRTVNGHALSSNVVVSATDITTGTLPDAQHSSNVPLKNATDVWTGRQDATGAASTAPAKTGTSLPGTCVVGDLYFKSDAAAGQNIYECQATNTWTQQTGGGGTPGGSSGQLQVNSSGSFAGQATVFGAGMTTTLKQTGVECTSGTISLSGSTWTYPGGTVSGAAATSQEFPITGTMSGNVRFAGAMLSEHVQFASGSVTAVKASIGRPGASTNDEMVPQFSLMQSGSDAWFTFDRPQPPVLTGTYSLVVALRTTGGNVSAISTGAAINFEVCAYVAQ
jgi:hypothetical protein